TDPGGSEALSEYSATIDWGDNSNADATGTLSYDSASHQFTLSGSHTYLEEGEYTATVTIHHGAAPDSVVTDSISVSDPAVIAVGGFSVSATEGSDSAI